MSTEIPPSLFPCLAKCFNEALAEAASIGSSSLVETFIAAGASVNAPDFTGCTPLMHAAVNGDVKSLRLLLASGARVNEETNRGLTALISAASNGNAGCVEELIAAGANVNKTGIRNEGTALSLACYAGYDQCVLPLLESGADVNHLNASDWTPLMTAACRGYEKCVGLILQTGAVVNQYKNSAFAIAVLANKYACVKMLLRYNTQTNVVNNFAADESVVSLGNLDTPAFVSKTLYRLLKASGQDMYYILDSSDSSEAEISERSLQDLCRNSIRKHLLFVDKHSHLFGRVPLLGLPNSLEQYLLYGVSLDDDDEEDDNDNIDECTSDTDDYSGDDSVANDVDFKENSDA